MTRDPNDKAATMNMHSAAAPAIELRGVSKSFSGAPAVRSVNLTAPHGAFIAIIGASGSGKTTTLKTINRLVEPDSGEILLEGEPVHASPPHLLRRRIGYVFQGVGLFPHMTVGENIAVTPRLLRWDEERITQRVAELLELVDLPQDYAQRFPSMLSGGQRQRVGVARALAARPAIMLMDEPFGALDPLTRDALGREYRRLHERLQLTTVMVTHDVLEAMLLADTILVMRAGEIIARGAPHELMNEHADAAVRELIDMPRRQAERVRSLIENAAAHG
jgi:osmoprotectant transport system ATP-binding protein